MWFIIKYFSLYYYKLAYRTRERVKPVGFIIMGNLGDTLYKLPWVFFSYIFLSIFVLTVPIGYASEVLKGHPIYGFNFIVVIPFFIGSMLLFDILAGKQQLASYKKLFRLFPFSIRTRTFLYLLNEIIGLKGVVFAAFIFLSVLFNKYYMIVEDDIYFNFKVFLFYIHIFLTYNLVIANISFYKIFNMERHFYTVVVVLSVLSLIFLIDILSTLQINWSDLISETYLWIIDVFNRPLMFVTFITSIFLLDAILLVALYFSVKNKGGHDILA